MDVWRAVCEHYIVSGVVVCWCVVWLYNLATRGVCKSKARMEGKTVIITGADSGNNANPANPATSCKLLMERNETSEVTKSQSTIFKIVMHYLATFAYTKLTFVGTRDVFLLSFLCKDIARFILKPVVHAVGVPVG
ncbi:hypothetical protein J6590_000811 [Homalodisca vitripennis]|nr:hypothetical protein J6590_000811 [Homalodisca vitripennis]